MSDTKKLAVSEKLGYGVGDFAANLFWMSFAFFLPYFYTDVFGLSAAAAATLLLATRLIDTVTDPLMGAMADRTHTRWGQFRPYILFGSFPFVLCCVAVFYVPDLSLFGKLLYAYITYILAVLFYTVVSIPYGALAGVMTPLSEERTKLQSYRFTAAFLGALTVQFSMLKMVKYFGQGDEPKGYLMATLVLAAIAICLYLVTFVTTRERVKPKATHDHDKPIIEDLKLLTKNSPWLVMSGVALFVMTYTAVRSGVTLYYFKYFFSSVEHSIFNLFTMDTPTLYMVTSRIGLIIGVLLTPIICRRFDKLHVFVGSLFLNGFFNCWLYLVQPGQLEFLITLDFVIGIVSGPTPVIMWACFADIADYEERQSGRRITGLIFSSSSFAIKMGFALGGFIVLQILAILGFEANREQLPIVVEGIRGIMSYIPGVCSVVAGCLLLFYRLDQRTVKSIEDELQSRKTSAPD